MTIQLFDFKNAPITDKLIEINDDRLLCNCDNIDLLPVGAIIDGENFDIGWNTQTKDKYVINKKDIKNVTFNQASGCCGPDGDKMNIRDKNNKAIGYEFGDCYMAHCLMILKNKVIAQTGQSDLTYNLFAMTEYKNELKIIERIVGFELNDIKQRLDLLVNKRLKQEINNEKIEKELKSKIIYYELKDMTHILDKIENIDDLWLFTKYENNKTTCR